MTAPQPTRPTTDAPGTPERQNNPDRFLATPLDILEPTWKNVQLVDAGEQNTSTKFILVTLVSGEVKKYRVTGTEGNDGKYFEKAVQVAL